MVALNFLFFVHYFFILPGKWELGELFMCQILRLLIYLFLYHYFIKAAANLIGKGQSLKWRKRLNNFAYTALAAWGVFLIIYVVFSIMN